MMTKVDLLRVLDLDAQATEGPWESDVYEVSQHWSRPEPWQVIASKEVDCGAYCYGGTARGIEKTEDADLIAYYRTAAPAMAHALKAVLEIHEADTSTGADRLYCTECTGTYDPDYVYYPCPTVQAIQEHLGDHL